MSKLATWPAMTAAASCVRQPSILFSGKTRRHRGDLSAVRRPNLGDDQGRRRPSSAQLARSQAIADFIVQSVQPATPAYPPSWARNSQNIILRHREHIPRFPQRRNLHHLSRPLFAECYNRYAFDLAGVEGTITIIEPKAAAPGKPWVFRADFVSRDAVVDLALLAKGFHIVTGPVPYNADGPKRLHWDAVYKHLTDNGFSSKPVMEGAGAAAGEAYAGPSRTGQQSAASTPKNPVLRSHMASTPPLDNLAPWPRPAFPSCTSAAASTPS